MGEADARAERQDGEGDDRPVVRRRGGGHPPQHPRSRAIDGNADAASKRGHPHLFNKLAKVLRDEGKPHPAGIVDEWDYGRGE